MLENGASAEQNVWSNEGTTRMSTQKSIRMCMAANSVLFLLCLASADDATVTLTESKTQITRISIAHDAGASVRFAAEELQRYIRRMSGAQLAILECLVRRGRRPALCAKQDKCFVLGRELVQS